MDECMLNDLLECSVCLERLDTSSKVLPCQHTFCKKCLEEIVSTHRELRCPECRVLVDAKVDDLPPNVLLMRILEGMRNATPKQPAKPHQPPKGATLASNQLASPPQIQPNNLSRLAVKQQIHNRPYGLAIYDYVSKVPGDLNFKKGDVIILRKKIDNNWYFGECGFNHGVFPLSYVQVMTPLPPHVPQCKALYDFRMSNDDEDGCLTFNKGEIISVIRRVDENWAEGKLLDRIGIFPLAFVELNSVARALMKLSTNVQPGPSRVAPPTPTNDDTTPLIPTDHSRNVQTSGQPRPQVSPATALAVSDSSSNISSGGSSTTSPNTPNSSSSSSSSSTAPSSPSSPAISPPAVGTRHNVKRHSFTAVNSGHQPHPHHRHSAEILSPAVDSVLSGVAAANDQTQSSNNDHHIRHRRSGSSDLVLAQPSQNLPGNLTSTNNLPAAYVALYPYKPQKSDELELRKGGIYMVSERCQDGWFKGTSNRTQKCGVFPGNYVAPANKCQRSVCRGSPTTTAQAITTATSSQSGADARLTSFSSKNKTASSTQPYSLRSLPPELPPRAVSPATAITSSWHPQRQSQRQSPPPRPAEQPSAAAIVRQHNNAMMGVASPGKLPPATTVATSLAPSVSITTNSDLSKSSGNTVQSVSPSAAPAVVNPNAKSSEKTKEKKDKGVSLMRRLTNMKKSKSPPPSTYSMDNPVFDDGNCATSSTTPVHIRRSAISNLCRKIGWVGKNRSGSCPSQLLQVGPAQEIIASNNPHRLYPGSAQGRLTTSQRIKHKERPSLPISFTQRSSEAGGAVTATNHHRKSNSLDAGMGKQVKQQVSSRERVYRFRCIVAYPPNSEFELELRVGDIIYVHKKRDDGWYKGTQQRTGRTGLFPASFVESF